MKSDEEVLEGEGVRRANWSPSRTVRGGRWVETAYVPTNDAVESALRIAKAGAPLPRLY